MIATILSDNRTEAPDRFGTEHGLSVHLQAPGCRILLDTGASDLFIRNAERLGVDLSEVDYVFLSHGHADHAGGLRAFLEINRKARVLVSPDAVAGDFRSERRGGHSISAEWPLDLMEGRTLYIDKSQAVSDSIHVLARIPQVHPLPAGNRHLLVRRGEGYVTDGFRHEMALYSDGFLFTGCAHNGLENILEACPYPLRTVLGGFHLLDAKGTESYESADCLKHLAASLAGKYPDTVFYTGHCTGNEAYRVMSSEWDGRLRRFSCGMRIDL